MNIYICLPNDFEFEFEASLAGIAGSPGKLSGPPETCYEAEPAYAEFRDYGPFYDMFDAVYAACWIGNCPMPLADMEALAEERETYHCQKYIESAEEPEAPDFDTD